MSHIIDPNQMRVKLNFRQSPAAFPSEFMLDTGTGWDVNIMGGLTKLEYAAIHIAAADQRIHPVDAVQRAAEILQQCAEYGKSPAPAADPSMTTESSN